MLTVRIRILVIALVLWLVLPAHYTFTQNTINNKKGYQIKVSDVKKDGKTTGYKIKFVNPSGKLVKNIPVWLYGENVFGMKEAYPPKGVKSDWQMIAMPMAMSYMIMIREKMTTANKGTMTMSFIDIQGREKWEKELVYCVRNSLTKGLSVVYNYAL